MPKWEDSIAPTLSSLPEDWRRMIREAPLPGLEDSPTVPELAEALDTPTAGDALNDACLSGLWLLAGDLPRSHSISQSLNTAEGSFWHGIMHRREGDFGNAKYWFRRVGSHPVIDALAEQAGDLYPSGAAFVDACERALRGTDVDQQACRRVQWLEWQLLFAHCLR